MPETPSIKDLNSLGIFSGRISEPQSKSMDSYPFIFFNGVKEVKLTYELAQQRGQESYIQYDLTLGQENEQMPKRFAALESALKSLFWKEVQLKLSINGVEYKNV